MWLGKLKLNKTCATNIYTEYLLINNKENKKKKKSCKDVKNKQNLRQVNHSFYITPLTVEFKLNEFDITKNLLQYY